MGHADALDRARGISGLIAVTGASGELGGRVVQRLAERDASMRLVVRDESRAPALGVEHEIAVAAGYHDRDAMTDAFRGADTVFLVSGREAPTRVEEHFSTVDAAADAGVRPHRLHLVSQRVARLHLHARAATSRVTRRRRCASSSTSTRSLTST